MNEDPEYPRADFEQHAERYGFKPSDYGRPFDWEDEYFALVGINPRARKWHCIARRLPGGDTYLFTAADVREQFALGGLAWEPRARTRT